MNGISFFFVMEKNCYALSVKKKISRSGRASAVHFAQKESVVVATTVVLSFLEKDLERTSLKKTAILQEINTNEKKKLKREGESHSSGRPACPKPSYFLYY